MKSQEIRQIAWNVKRRDGRVSGFRGFESSPHALNEFGKARRAFIALPMLPI
jgi:hypothetical protein